MFFWGVFWSRDVFWSRGVFCLFWGRFSRLFGAFWDFSSETPFFYFPVFHRFSTLCITSIFPFAMSLHFSVSCSKVKPPARIAISSFFERVFVAPVICKAFFLATSRSRAFSSFVILTILEAAVRGSYTETDSVGEPSRRRFLRFFLSFRDFRRLRSSSEESDSDEDRRRDLDFFDL